MALISLSIVSHAQGALVAELLNDIAIHCKDNAIEIILTLNLPESVPFEKSTYPFVVKTVQNPSALGFGANHNQAFQIAEGDFFCVMNPDIRLKGNPFIHLISHLSDSGIGCIAPKIVNILGQREDNGRRFPSPLLILCKLLRGCSSYEYEGNGDLIYPDWIGGMFMLFPSDVFRTLRGFDERYFLYYEDVDLCARMHRLGLMPAINQKISVVHDARRDSHKNLKYFRWHIFSMLRFFSSYSYLQILLARWGLIFKKNN